MITTLDVCDMDRILQMDYERARRSNHPKFIQIVAIRMSERDINKLDELINKINFLHEGYKQKDIRSPLTRMNSIRDGNPNHVY
jgi:hypothetical protein